MGGKVPKQYLQIAGVTLLEHSLQALLTCERLASVVVALHPEDRTAAKLPLLADSRVRLTVGGARRSDSVLAGIRALAEQATEDDWVLVHDAARPCLQLREIERLITAVADSGTGGILAQPIVDTVKLAGEDGLVVQTLDRDTLWRAQTPQMFRLGQLREALSSAQEQGLEVTDEASAMEQAGYPVQLVTGSSRNLKVTVPADLKLAAWILAAAEAGDTPGEKH
jgi:2-C-methyl-D-erythritol 4-phosphate cytidylyltransferase